MSVYTHVRVCEDSSRGRVSRPVGYGSVFTRGVTPMGCLTGDVGFLEGASETKESSDSSGFTGLP